MTKGAVLARIVAPKPYADYSGVSAAADDRTFVLVAEEKSASGDGAAGAANIPTAATLPGRASTSCTSTRAKTQRHPGGRASCSPAGRLIPAGDKVHDMALSPDGHSLAADVGGVLFNTQLYVYNLATGTKRAWSYKTCSH